MEKIQVEPIYLAIIYIMYGIARMFFIFDLHTAKE